MKKLGLNIALISILSVVSITASSQTLLKVANRLSVTGGLGFSYYNGDLNGDLWNINPKVLHFAWRLGLDYDINKKWRVGYSYLNGGLSGSDAYYENDSYRFNVRRKDFITDLTSHDLLLKYYLLHKGRLRLDLVAGGAYFTFSPTVLNANYNTIFTPTNETSSYSVSIGSEVIYQINRNWSVSALSLYQQGFSDFVDATDLNKGSLDRYIDIVVGVRYHIRTGSGGAGFEGTINPENCPAF